MDMAHGHGTWHMDMDMDMATMAVAMAVGVAMDMDMDMGGSAVQLHGCTALPLYRRSAVELNESVET